MSYMGDNLGGFNTKQIELALLYLKLKNAADDLGDSRRGQYLFTAITTGSLLSRLCERENRDNFSRNSDNLINALSPIMTTPVNALLGDDPLTYAHDLIRSL